MAKVGEITKGVGRNRLANVLTPRRTAPEWNLPSRTGFCAPFGEGLPPSGPCHTSQEPRWFRYSESQIETQVRHGARLTRNVVVRPGKPDESPFLGKSEDRSGRLPDCRPRASIWTMSSILHNCHARQCLEFLSLAVPMPFQALHVQVESVGHSDQAFTG